MKAVWLVTGANGLVGRHVLDALSAAARRPSQSETEVVVLGRHCPPTCLPDNFVAADLTDADQLRQAIERIVPDFVIHTAGRTPPASDQELYRANFWATIHLLSALRWARRPARIVLSGSAAELGPVDPSSPPVEESYPGYPRDSYGRSKRLATSAGIAQQAPLEVVVARVFSAIGPGTPTTQGFGRFADRLTEPDPDPLDLEIGDVDARSDFIDARDVARAIIALALRGQSGLVYNIGTGRSRSVLEGLGRLIHLSGRSVSVRVDPSVQKRRGSGEARANIDRIVRHTNWWPAISWEQSFDDLWREVEARKRLSRVDTEAAA